MAVVEELPAPNPCPTEGDKGCRAMKEPTLQEPQREAACPQEQLTLPRNLYLIYFP